MEPGPSRDVVQRAIALQREAKNLAAEASQIWSEVEGCKERQVSEDDTKQKLERLQEVRMKMTSTAADFTELVKKTPGVVIWLERGQIGLSNKQSAKNELGDSKRAAPKKPEPPSGQARRMSRFSTTSANGMSDAYTNAGGRLVSIPTGSEYLGELECILLEPEGRQMARTQFISTGLVICLQGLPISRETVEEWCDSSTALGLLNLGVTVAIPNISASSALNAEDMGLIVSSIAEWVDFDSCILVGKDLLAYHMVSLTFLETLDVRIAGVLLLGPCTPVPDQVEDMPSPLLVLWAQDDPVCPFEDRAEWVESFGDAQVSRLTSYSSGGHRLDHVLKNPGCSEVVRNYCVSCFMLMTLLQDMNEQQCRLDQEPKTDAEIRFRRLLEELPGGLKEAAKEGNNRRMGLASGLAAWIQSGLCSVSE